MLASKIPFTPCIHAARRKVTTVPAARDRTALRQDEAVGTELRDPFCALRGRLREEGVNFSGVGRGSAGYGSMAIRVDEQCPSTPTVVVQENLIGRAGGLEYLIVTAPVSLSLESS